MNKFVVSGHMTINKHTHTHQFQEWGKQEEQLMIQKNKEDSRLQINMKEYAGAAAQLSQIKGGCMRMHSFHSDHREIQEQAIKIDQIKAVVMSDLTQ